MSLRDYGDPVIGVSCPKCGVGQVVYNGNYFCDTCKWAMKDRYTPTGRLRKTKEAARDSEIVRAYLYQRRAQAEKAGDSHEVERMDLYLKDSV